MWALPNKKLVKTTNPPTISQDVLEFEEFDEFDVVKVNYDGPFLRTQPIDLSNSEQQLTHLVEHERVQKTELRIIGPCRFRELTSDSNSYEKMRMTILRLEKSAKYRLADIREAIKKSKVKKNKKKDDITYYNSATKCIEGETNQPWQFQGLLDHLNHTEASPSKIREVFCWLKEKHCALLPNLPVKNTRVPNYTEEDLLSLLRLHIKDESLLCIDYNNIKDYFKCIECSIDNIEQNPNLILQYLLYTENTPKYKVKTLPGSDGDLVLDHFINRLIDLNNSFLSKYPEIYSSIKSLDNFQELDQLATLSVEDEVPNSSQDMIGQPKHLVENSESRESFRFSDQPLLIEESTPNYPLKKLHQFSQEEQKNAEIKLDHIIKRHNSVNDSKNKSSLTTLDQPPLLDIEIVQKSNSTIHQHSQEQQENRKITSERLTKELNSENSSSLMILGRPPPVLIKESTKKRDRGFQEQQKKAKMSLNPTCQESKDSKNISDSSNPPQKTSIKLVIKKSTSSGQSTYITLDPNRPQSATQTNNTTMNNPNMHQYSKSSEGNRLKYKFLKTKNSNWEIKTVPD